jgi:uroporphyrin-3 C-methyltransferase
VPQQLQELTSATEELRGRAEGPERAWSRAEAMYLLELAQQRLALDRDVDTAIVALESADARLASLRDASFAPVRQQIARDLQALRAVQRPDVTGISARIASLEERVTDLPVKGIIAAERSATPREELPQSFLPRAWAILRNSVASLIRVREVDEKAGGIVTQEEALLRREHLQLLLFSARSALARHDGDGYRQALASARKWLGESFDVADPSANAVLKEVQALEPIDVDPQLPEISGSIAALRRLVPREKQPLPAGPE